MIKSFEIDQKNKQSLPLNELALGFLLISFFIAFFPVWKSLFYLWSRSDDYSHGFFIVPICLYAVWEKKSLLLQTTIKPSNWGVLIFIFSLMLYIIAYYAEIYTLTAFSMIPLISGIIIFVYGFQMMNILLFPVTFLIFMIPIPGQVYSSLTIPLQLFVSKIAVLVTSFSGIPIYREGNVIHLPGRVLEVVQACSGLRSLISILTLSTAFGYFTLKSKFFRCILIIFSIPTVILTNIFRVFLMIIAFYYYDYDLTTGSVHTIVGIMIFVIGLTIIGMTQRILSIWDK